MLADLPGYGYASAPKQNVRAWTRLVELYLSGRPPLRRAMVLIDARHGVKEVDRGVMAMLDRTAVSYQLVLTKADKITASVMSERRAALTAEVATRTAAHPDVLATSARTGEGIAEIRANLAALSDWTADLPA